MDVKNLHQWRMTPGEAVALQKELRALIKQSPPLDPKNVRFVGGIDVSSSMFDKILTAGVVVWDRETNTIVETQSVQMERTFPYIPGLLSFREIPAVMEALKKLKTIPDVFLVDGHGCAHPRRMGIATHAGLLIDTPTIGVAKSRLTGTEGLLGPNARDTAPLTDGDERIGMILRSKNNVKPVYVSNGNNIDLDSAVDAVKMCLRGYRLPEPTRLAHVFVNEVRKAANRPFLALS